MRAFSEAYGHHVGTAPTPAEAAALDEWFARAQDTYGVGAVAFAAHLASRRLTPAELVRLAPHDLLCALAAHSGNPLALRAVDELLRRGGNRVVSRLPDLRPHLDDALQRLRAKLLLPESASLASYSGTGPLRGWLQTAVMRELQRLRERASRASAPSADAPASLLAAMPTTDFDAELRMMKSRYLAPFRQAFHLALGALTVEERNLLRLVYLDGVNFTALGRARREHRVTTARAVVKARERLLAETRAQLAGLIRVEQAEIDGIVEAVRSDLSSSFRAILRDDEQQS